MLSLTANAPFDIDVHLFYSGLREKHTHVWCYLLHYSFNLFIWSCSSAIIHDIEGLRRAGLAMMAYYYFDFRDIKKQDRDGLLTSLLSQLSAESDACYEVLSQLYSHNTGGTRKPTNGSLIQCMKDILGSPRQGTIYVIIDGLDECPDISGVQSAREKVLDLIDELVNLHLPNVHICVASRPEIDIRNALEPLKPLEISLHDHDGQKNDIIEYIKSVIHSDRKMKNWREEDKQLVIDTLSDRADGMWVFLSIALCSTKDAHMNS